MHGLGVVIINHLHAACYVLNCNTDKLVVRIADKLRMFGNADDHIIRFGSIRIW